VGSYEREFCRAAGSAQSLLQPFLDSQVRVLMCNALV
jgi:20S proteasome subunit beta 6